MTAQGTHVANIDGFFESLLAQVVKNSPYSDHLRLTADLKAISDQWWFVISPIFKPQYTGDREFRTTVSRRSTVNPPSKFVTFCRPEARDVVNRLRTEANGTLGYPTDWLRNFVFEIWRAPMTISRHVEVISSRRPSNFRSKSRMGSGSDRKSPAQWGTVSRNKLLRLRSAASPKVGRRRVHENTETLSWAYVDRSYRHC